MNLVTKALGMGYKLTAKVIGAGKAIPYNLEACIRDYDLEKARLIADPEKIDNAYRMVFEEAEHRIQTIEKRNWYYWAKPKRSYSSAEYGAERVFKDLYKGELLTDEEKQVVLAALAIQIEEELRELKKERNIILK